MVKKDYQDMLLSLIEPLKDKYSSKGALLMLGGHTAGYGKHIAGMEGFSRILWGLAPYWSGLCPASAGGERTAETAAASFSADGKTGYSGCRNKEAQEWAQRYRKGLAAGTAPDSPEYWGDLGNRDQRMVEMAAICYGILLAPQYLWEPLSSDEKCNVIRWLKQINLYDMPENNWQYFAVMVNLTLKSVGAEYDSERMKKSMELYESFYLGNGWYSDGKRPQKDYYVSFAIHFYCLLYAKFAQDFDDDKERVKIFKDRAGEFAKDFIYWFDEEGRGLPFGRSLTYRFAQVAFFSASLLADAADVLPLGVVKGIIERNLVYWFSQPVYDNGGVLTIGYRYPNMHMSEAYNAPGSPYWALKSFAFLALPDEHPFWSAEAEPLPNLKSIYLIKEADMLIQHRRRSAGCEAEAAALTSGQYSLVYHTHTAEKYAKFAYSTKWGFSVPRSYCSLSEAATDSMLAFEINGMYYVRRKCISYSVTEKEVSSVWSPYPGITVSTRLVPTENGHERFHMIHSDIECEAYDCGFSYPYEPYGANKTVISESAAESEPYGMAEAGDEIRLRAKAKAENSLPFEGKSYGQIEADCGESKVIIAAPNTNLMFPLSCIPAIHIKIAKGDTVIHSKISAE